MATDYERTVLIVRINHSSGRSVAETFRGPLKEYEVVDVPDWQILGFTQSKNASALADSIPEVCVYDNDLDDAEFLAMAFRGSHTVFFETDFMPEPSRRKQIIEDNGYHVFESTLKACLVYELDQMIKVVNAAEEALASERSRQKCFILSTLSYACLEPDIKATEWLPDEANGSIRRWIRKSRLASIARYLQPGFYMSNLTLPFLQPKRASDGVYEFRWPFVQLHTKIPMVSWDRDAGRFVRALVDAEPGTALLAAGIPMVMSAVVNTWSHVTGEPARLVRIRPDQFIAAVEQEWPNFGKVISDLLFFCSEQRWEGNGRWTGKAKGKGQWVGGDDEVMTAMRIGMKTGEFETLAQYLERTFELDPKLLGIMDN